MSVILCNKTGALTQNRLVLQEIVAFPGFSRLDVLEYATLCSNADADNAIDQAIVDVTSRRLNGTDANATALLANSNTNDPNTDSGDQPESSLSLAYPLDYYSRPDLRAPATTATSSPRNSPASAPAPAPPPAPAADTAPAGAPFMTSSSEPDHVDPDLWQSLSQDQPIATRGLCFERYDLMPFDHQYRRSQALVRVRTPEEQQLAAALADANAVITGVGGAGAIPVRASSSSNATPASQPTPARASGDVLVMKGSVSMLLSLTAGVKQHLVHGSLVTGDSPRNSFSGPAGGGGGGGGGGRGRFSFHPAGFPPRTIATGALSQATTTTTATSSSNVNVNANSNSNSNSNSLVGSLSRDEIQRIVKQQTDQGYTVLAVCRSATRSPHAEPLRRARSATDCSDASNSAASILPPNSPIPAAATKGLIANARDAMTSAANAKRYSVVETSPPQPRSPRLYGNATQHHQQQQQQPSANDVMVHGWEVYREFPDIQIVGLLCFRDPPRPESAQVIASLRGLGVNVKVLTGDSVAVTTGVAQTVGIGSSIVNMEQERNLIFRASRAHLAAKNMLNFENLRLTLPLKAQAVFNRSVESDALIDRICGEIAQRAKRLPHSNSTSFPPLSSSATAAVAVSSSHTQIKRPSLEIPTGAPTEGPWPTPSPSSISMRIRDDTDTDLPLTSMSYPDTAPGGGLHMLPDRELAKAESMLFPPSGPVVGLPTTAPLVTSPVVRKRKQISSPLFHEEPVMSFREQQALETFKPRSIMESLTGPAPLRSVVVTQAGSSGLSHSGTAAATASRTTVAVASSSSSSSSAAAASATLVPSAGGGANEAAAGDRRGPSIQHQHQSADGPPGTSSAGKPRALSLFSFLSLFQQGTEAVGKTVDPAVAFEEEVLTRALSKRVQELLDSADGFAQVSPQEKLMLVKLYQEHGHIVGMTGDGTNDAPALKQAGEFPPFFFVLHEVLLGCLSCVFFFLCYSICL